MLTGSGVAQRGAQSVPDYLLYRRPPLRLHKDYCCSQARWGSFGGLCQRSDSSGPKLFWNRSRRQRICPSHHSLPTGLSVSLWHCIGGLGACFPRPGSNSFHSQGWRNVCRRAPTGRKITFWIQNRKGGKEYADFMQVLLGTWILLCRFSIFRLYADQVFNQGPS